jgi:hypothetical protein
MDVVLEEHHYLMMTVSKHRVQVCPRRADRTLLEACDDCKPPKKK